MGSHFFRRRNFIVQPRFQLLLAAKAVFFLCLYVGAIVYTSLQSMAETIYILPLNCLTPEVKARVWAFPTETLLLSLLMALVAVLQLILFSHRIAGPEFRLKRIVREMAAGQYPQSVTLRKNDCLKGLAETLMRLGQVLGQRRQALLDQLAQLQRNVEESTARVRSGAHPEAVLAQFEGLAKRICFLEQIAAGDNVPGGAGQAAESMSKPVQPASIPLSSG